jgi:glutamate:GABA antiporter
MTDAPAPQKLGFIDTAAYMIAVGIGIRWIAVAAAVGPASLPMWLLALLVFFVPLSVATAELTSRYDVEGGIYAWARDGIGPLAGFICGWFYWLALMPYFATILYFLSNLVVAALEIHTKSPWVYIAISTAILGLVACVQIAGLKYGKWVPNLGTAGGWIVVLTIVAMGVVIAARGKSATDFSHASWIAPANFPTAILWGTIVFAYSGMETAGMLRNEITGGLRTIVRVLIVVGIGSLFVYIAGTSSFLVILPQSELTRLGGFADALRTGLEHLGLGKFSPYVMSLFALSMLGGFTAWYGVGARLPFAAGIDAFLPPLFAKRNPKTGAPVNAILLQTGLTFVMVLLSQAGSSVSGAYDRLVDMAVLGATVPYLFMFWVHIRGADLPPVPGLWKPPGGARTTRVLGWVGMVASAVAILCTLVPSSDDPNPLLAVAKIVLSTLVTAAVGLALYWLAKRKST